MSRDMWSMMVGFGSGLVLGFVIHAFLVRPSRKDLRKLEERQRIKPADFEPRRAAHGWEE
jgi:hypothetical protein